MAVIQGRTWLEILPPPACWGLLRSCHVGRVAFVVEGEPEVLPVNFVVDGDTVVFRTDPGTKLDAVLHGSSVAFEVDHSDEAVQTGWSIVVKGRAQEILDPADLRHARSLPLRPWSFGEKSHWVRIVPRAMTGRRIVRVGTDEETD